MSQDFNQITIPTFDDDVDFTSPFGGSSSSAFGQGGGASSSAFAFGHSGRDSPPPMFAGGPASSNNHVLHSRDASIASDTSSIRHGKASHHQPSASSPSNFSLPSRKSSFANLKAKNPFKSSSSKAAAAAANASTPPIPDNQTSRPPLHEPFKKKKSANQLRSERSPNGAPSGKGSHMYGRSADNSPASSPGYFATSTPPIPRIPNGVRHHASRSDLNAGGPPESSPAEYALSVIFVNFVSSTDALIEAILKQGLDDDPYLPAMLGPGKDPTFDSLLDSLARIGQKHTIWVMNAILRWKGTQNEGVDQKIVRRHLTQSPAPSIASSKINVSKFRDIELMLNERKSHTAIYIMCRALISILKVLQKDVLGDEMGFNLEDTTFEQFRNPDLKSLARSANHRACADLCATLLGQLSAIRFTSVTDRFLAALSPLSKGNGKIPKDDEAKYENLVKNMGYLQIKVYPPEAFEDGADFLLSLAGSFVNAHGQRLKGAFAEMFVRLLHPMGKTAQAEVNHPVWVKAIDMIFPKAKDMMSKPRYWTVAYPLMVMILCVGPQELFLKHWQWCFDAGAAKLKDKSLRVPVLNSMARLIWTYLYRHNEATPVTTSKLDASLRVLFPLNRSGVFPGDEPLDAFIYILHFIMSRHFEFGKELVLDLVQETAVNNVRMPKLGANASGGALGVGATWGLEVLAPERMIIGLRALLLTLDIMQREQGARPTWPTSADFGNLSFDDDYPFTATFLPDAFYTRSGMLEFFDRCGPVISRIANICYNAVGTMSISDQQYFVDASLLSSEERDSMVIKVQSGVTIGYPKSLIPTIDLLFTCFESWPRCLHPTSLPLSDALDMLIRGVIHIEGTIADAATAALFRFAVDDRYTKAVLLRYTRFLFSSKRIQSEGFGTKLILEMPRLLEMWVQLVDSWSKRTVVGFASKDGGWEAEKKLGGDVGVNIPINNMLDDVEAGALFLLSSTTLLVREMGVKVLRMLHVLVPLIPVEDVDADFAKRGSSILGMLIESCPPGVLEDKRHILDTTRRDRLHQWRDKTDPDKLLRLAESDSILDQRVWEYAYPYLIHACHLPNNPTTVQTPTAFEVRAGRELHVLALFRESLMAAVTRFHPFMVAIAGFNGKGPTGAQGARSPPVPNNRREREREKDIVEHLPAIQQWQIWISSLCAGAVDPDSPTTAPEREVVTKHARASSDVNGISNKPKSISSTGGLLAHIINFLACDFGPVRNAVVLALACIQKPAYPILLDKMQTITRHIFDVAKQPSSAKYPRPKTQDRQHTSVAQVFQLTAHFVQDSRLLMDQKTLRPLLQFVREMKTFLLKPDAQIDWELQPLRRYFCGVVEHLFDGLSTLPDSDRFYGGANNRLSLYRLCEEWCTYGPIAALPRQRGLAMKTTVEAIPTADPNEKTRLLELYKVETVALAGAAAAAMAVLCQGAFFATELESGGSPTESGSGHGAPPEPLGVTITLVRITAMLGSASASVRASGRKSLRALLLFPTKHEALIDTAMSFSYVTSKDADSDKARFFEVVAEIILTAREHSFSFAQMVALSLANLCHTQVQTRHKAFEVLEFIQSSLPGTQPLAPFEAAVGSQSASIYLPAQRQISIILGATFALHGESMLSQLALRIPQVYDNLPELSPMFHSHILTCLEPWIGSITLIPDGMSELSTEGHRALYNLTSLTVRYGDEYPDQVQALWARLVSASFANVNATVKFLIEQATYRGNPKFITQAKRIISHLSRTPVGKRTFIELCSVIEPSAMLPTQEMNPSMPDLREGLFFADLDALLPLEGSRLVLGTGQLALLFVCDLALDRAWELGEQLPVLLHAVFSHIDYRVSFVRKHAQRFFFQIIRSWTPGYDELAVHSLLPPRVEIKEIVDELEAKGTTLFWTEGEADTNAAAKMDVLCSAALSLLSPVYPQLRQQWGELAVHWGTSCPIRPIAFRSLQLFRVLMPEVDSATLGLLLGRLSNTLAHPDENISMFTREIIITLTALARSDLAASLFPQLFWSACACLSTTVEKEFISVLDYLTALLDRLDLNDEDTVEHLLVRKPPTWTGPDPCLQSLVIVGLRSANTSGPSMKVLKRLAQIDSSELLDAGGNRVRSLYAVCLPWCLQAMDADAIDESMHNMALDIARLADLEGRNSISRIMTSFAKKHFRTRGDFLQQAIRSIKENFGNKDPTLTVQHLMALVLNRNRWLRVKSMEVLKGLLGHKEARSPLHGSDLLMPLLRLLSTDLAPQALEVLEEPLTITGGPSTHQVLRMSMYAFSSKQKDEDEVDALAFGLPEDSGWCIARLEETAQLCRQNIMAVFDTCQVAMRPSMIVFEPEIFVQESASVNSSFPRDNATTLGDLVSTLYDLNTYYQHEEARDLGTPGFVRPESNLLYSPVANTEVTQSKVAAILSSSRAISSRGPPDPLLSRSFSISSIDWNRHKSQKVPAGFGPRDPDLIDPPTPFIGLFNISKPETSSLIGGPSLLQTRSRDTDFENPRPPTTYKSSPMASPKDMATMNQNFLAYSDEEETDSVEASIGVAITGNETFGRGLGRANSLAFTESVYSTRGESIYVPALPSSSSPGKVSSRMSKLHRAASYATRSQVESSDSEGGESFALEDPFVHNRPPKITATRRKERVKQLLGSNPSLKSTSSLRSVSPRTPPV